MSSQDVIMNTNSEAIEIYLTDVENLASWSMVVKRLFDIVAASLLLISVLPIFAVVCFLVRRDGAPAFYAHQRIGRGGRLFPCLKFRTMVPDSARILQETLANDPALAQEWEQYQKLKEDPRITRVGKFLRRFSIDELPQLINVLRGEMSLVGPRPIVEAEISKFGSAIGFYYSMRPGLTGLWQVSGRNRLSSSERVQLDVRYVQEWSLLRDGVILLKTFSAVLAADGAC